MAKLLLLVAVISMANNLQVHAQLGSAVDAGKIVYEIAKEFHQGISKSASTEKKFQALVECINIIKLHLNKFPINLEAKSRFLIESIIHAVVSQRSFIYAKDSLRIYIQHLDEYYSRFLTIPEVNLSPGSTVLDSYSRQALSYKAEDLEDTLARVYRFLVPGEMDYIYEGMLETLNKRQNETEFNERCDKEMSYQEGFRELIEIGIICEIRGFAIRAFAMNYLCVRGEHTEGEVRNDVGYTIEKSIERISGLLNAMKTLMSLASREMFRCEPSQHVLNETSFGVVLGDSSLVTKTISLDPQISDINNNMVVTDVRFVKMNNIVQIELEIEQGSLLPEGRINNSTVSSESQGNPRHIPTSSVEIDLSEHNRSTINLDEIYVPKGYVVTGVKFDIGPIQLKVHGTPFDYKTGLLHPTRSNPSKWFSASDMKGKIYRYNSKRETVNIKNFDGPKKYTGSVKESLPNSDVKLQVTSEEKEQTVIPYFDAQWSAAGTDRFALDGVGIFHRSSVQEKYGGFIAPKIFTLDQTLYIKPDISSEDTRKYKKFWI